MEQEVAPQTPETIETASFDRIVNVFASPLEAFAGISTAKSRTMLWLIPLIVTCIMGIGVTYITLSNPTFREQVLSIQRTAMQENVQKGKMTQAQADRTIEGIEGMNPTIFLVFGIVSAIVMICIFFFVGALLAFLVGKWALHSAEAYGVYLTAMGLASWIGILGSIITVILMMVFNTMYATPSPALAIISSFDPMNTTHRLLSSLNLFTIWEAVVFGVGIGAIAKKSTTVGIIIGIVFFGVIMALSLLLR
jgi:hypothetical protein